MVEKLEGVSLGEVRYMLRDYALHEVTKAWMVQAEERSSFKIVKNLTEGWKSRICIASLCTWRRIQLYLAYFPFLYWVPQSSLS